MVAWPTLAVEVAFAGNPNDASPTWTDITTYVQGFSTKRGRSTELDVFAPGQATIKLDNRDRRFDPDYSGSPYFPNVQIGKRLRISAIHSSTTYYLFDGYIDSWPQTWESRVAASVPLQSTDAFKRFQQFPLMGNYSAVVMAQAPKAFYEFNGNLNDSSGNANTGTWTGTSGATYGGWGPFSGLPGAAIPPAIYPSTSKYFGANDYMAHGTTGWSTGEITIEAWWYPSGWTGADSVAHGLWQSHAPVWANPANGIIVMKWSSNQMYFRVISSAAVLQDLAPAVDATSMPANTFTYWVFTASHDSGMQIYRNGVLFAGPYLAGTLDMPGILPPAPRVGQGHDAFANGSYLARVALYDRVLPADQVYDRHRSIAANVPVETTTLRIGRVLDILGWPSARRDLDGGAATLAAGAPNEQMLSYLQKVNNSEVGRLFMGANGDVRFIGRDASILPPYTTNLATFGDDAAGAELPYSDLIINYDDAQTWNEIRMQRDGGRLQIARDAVLQTTDLVRTFTDTTLMHSTDAQTLSAAQYRLSQYSEPRLRIEQLTISPQRQPDALWPQALGRDIGDRVTIIRRPQGVGAAISHQCTIEGIAHEFDVTSSWRTTYNLSRADLTSYWVLGLAGFSELDTTTRLSP